MANKRLDYDKIHELIMECRTSGLTDRQWCTDHDIPPSTFYTWVRRLRQKACYEIPEHAEKTNRIIPAAKQDVVCVPVTQPESLQEPATAQDGFYPRPAESIILQYQGASLMIPEEFSGRSLARILCILKESLC